MRRFHCRAIHYERHDCPFIAYRGISLKLFVYIRSDAGLYVLIRFVVLGYDMITIAQFLTTHQIRLDRIFPIGSTMWCGPDTIMTIEVPDLR